MKDTGFFAVAPVQAPDTATKLLIFVVPITHRQGFSIRSKHQAVAVAELAWQRGSQFARRQIPKFNLTALTLEGGQSLAIRRNGYGGNAFVMPAQSGSKLGGFLSLGNEHRNFHDGRGDLARFPSIGRQSDTSTSFTRFFRGLKQALHAIPPPPLSNGTFFF